MTILLSVIEEARSLRASRELGCGDQAAPSAMGKRSAPPGKSAVR
jgi:hypothetical protein